MSGARWSEEQYAEYLKDQRQKRSWRQRWTPEHVRVLMELGPQLTARELGEKLGMSETDARKGAHYRGVQLAVVGPRRPTAWTADEIAALREAYAQEIPRVKDLAARLGRQAGNVSRKAREFGLTDPRRIKKPIAERRPPRRKSKSDEELREMQSAAAKRRIADHGHPRGFRGRHHSDEVKRDQSALAQSLWRDPASPLNSDANRQRLSDNVIARVQRREMVPGHSWGAGGRRVDLGGRYFRSSWEANYARYLTWLISRGELHDWEYEPQTFVFEEIKRGTRSYTPDFKVWKQDGGPHEWHEVKGYLDARGKVRLDRFRKYYPAEKLIVVNKEWFASANRLGLPHLIPNWESGIGAKGGRKLKPAQGMPADRTDG